MSTKRATERPIDVDVEGPEMESEQQPLLDRLEQFGHDVSDFVVRRPLSSVGIALGVGFLFGRAMRRW